MNRHLAFDGFTASHSKLNISAFNVAATYIFSKRGVEPRSRAGVWDELSTGRPHQCVEILKQSERDFVARINGAEHIILLTDIGDITRIFLSSIVYVDMTGLGHNLWSALLRAMLSRAEVVEGYFIYSEPDVYQSHQSPSSNNLFDLSAAFGGIAPLPGMANLTEVERGIRTVLVPFLGFETARAQFIANTLDPIPKVIPVVGLPGFRIDYPQVTVASNDSFLDDTRSYSSIRYARASCPFEAYSVLADISRDNPGSFIYIAPIGTKPHSLGAVWFAIDHPQETEVIYDHPVRKNNRSTGIGQTHIYKIKPRDVDL